MLAVNLEFLRCKHERRGGDEEENNGRALQAALLPAWCWYLRGCGAGLHPGAELGLCDLAAVVPAVEQAARHRVLLPGEPARITKSLPARKGVSCTGRKTPLSLLTRCRGCCIDNNNKKYHRHMTIRSIDWCYLIENHLQATCVDLLLMEGACQAGIKNNKHGPNLLFVWKSFGWCLI